MQANNDLTEEDAVFWSLDHELEHGSSHTVIPARIKLPSYMIYSPIAMINCDHSRHLMHVH